MGFWKLDVLKRWFDNEEKGKGKGSEGDPAEDEDEDDDAEAGDGQDDGDDDGEGEGAGDDDGDAGDGSEPGDGDGGDGRGDGEDGAGAGYSPDAGGEIPDGAFDPEAFGDLDKLKDSDIRGVDPEVNTDRDVKTTEGEVQVGRCGEGIIEENATNAEYSMRLAKDAVASCMGLAGVRTVIRRLLARTDTFGEERNLRRGRVIASHLYRVPLGAEDVFSRRTDEDGEDVAVSIVIDNSGSMGGRGARLSPIQMAATTAVVLGEALSTTPGVKYEVLGFGAYCGFADDDKTEHDAGAQSEYAKVSAGNHPTAGGTMLAVYKSFAETHGKFLRRFSVLWKCAQGGTPDLAALDGAVKRLVKQPAGRRIVVFITDGQGDCRFADHRKALEKKHDVLCIGIGIGTNLFGRFEYQAQCHSPRDLAKVTLAAIVKAVEKAGKV